MDDLTQEEVEALRFLLGFNDHDSLEPYYAWDQYFRQVNVFAQLSERGLTRWAGGYPGDWRLTDKGRAVVERLGAE